MTNSSSSLESWLLALFRPAWRAGTRFRAQMRHRPSSRFRSIRAVTLLSGILIGGCGDNSGPTGPTGGGPSAIALSLPPDVIVDRSFSLAVTALGPDGTSIDGSFNGTVHLSVTRGTIVPSSLTLTNGSGNGDFTLSGAVGAVDLTAQMGNVSASAATTVLGTTAPVRIEVTPSALLLTGTGEVRQMTARAYDANGLRTVAEVTWQSSAPAVIVSSEGLAIATMALGSAQIVAEAAGVTSTPVVALIAQPVAGTVLIADEEFVSGPIAVDPADQFGDGWRYQVLLRNVAPPSPGTILLASGGAMVAGRVVSAAPADSLTAVTLELIPLNQIFQALEIRIDMPMEEAPLVETPAAGVFRPSFAQSRYDIASDELEFPVGPFKCKLGGATIPQISLQNVSTSMTGSLNGRFVYTLQNGFEGVVVRGTIGGKITARPIIDIAWGGSAKCERDVRVLTIPIGGWVAFFFGFQVPLGAGFSIEGQLDLGEVGFDIAAEASASLEIGYLCENGAPCRGVMDLDSNAEATLRLVTPEDLQDVRVAVNGRGYIYAKLNLGPSQALLNRIPALGAIKFKLLEASAGMEQTVDLASSARQIGDPAYASRLATLFNADVKADLELKTGFEWMEKKLGVVIQLAEAPLWQYEKLLAETPRGIFTIEPASVRPGDDEDVGDFATFKVELDPVTYFGSYAVDRIEIFWRKVAADGSMVIEFGRPSCRNITASPGQTTFQCQTDFLEEHLGEQTFYALVHTRVFGIPIPMPLEVALDGRATVMVEEEPGEPVPPDPPGGLNLSGSWTLVVDEVCTGPMTVNHSGTAFSVSGSIGGGICPFSAVGSGDGILAGLNITFGLAFGTGSNTSGIGVGDVAFAGVVDASGDSMTGTYGSTTDMTGVWRATRQ